MTETCINKHIFVLACNDYAMSSCANIRKKNLNFDNINFYCEALKILIAQQLLIARVGCRHKDSASHRSFKSLALDFVLIRPFQISKHFEVLVLLSKSVINFP